MNNLMLERIPERDYFYHEHLYTLKYKHYKDITFILNDVFSYVEIIDYILFKGNEEYELPKLLVCLKFNGLSIDAEIYIDRETSYNFIINTVEYRYREKLKLGNSKFVNEELKNLAAYYSLPDRLYDYIFDNYWNEVDSIDDSDIDEEYKDEYWGSVDKSFLYKRTEEIPC